MAKFVNERMTAAEQVEYAWRHRDLFERCRSHNLRVCVLRQKEDAGRYVSGWEVNAELLLAVAQDKVTRI